MLSHCRTTVSDGGSGSLASISRRQSQRPLLPAVHSRQDSTLGSTVHSLLSPIPPLPSSIGTQDKALQLDEVVGDVLTPSYFPPPPSSSRTKHCSWMKLLGMFYLPISPSPPHAPTPTHTHTGIPDKALQLAEVVVVILTDQRVELDLDLLAPRERKTTALGAERRRNDRPRGLACNTHTAKLVTMSSRRL